MYILNSCLIVKILHAVSVSKTTKNMDILSELTGSVAVSGQIYLAMQSVEDLFIGRCFSVHR